MDAILEAATSDFINLKAEVENQLYVPSNELVESVRHRFDQNEFDFMAVLEAGTLIGIVSRRRLGMYLSSQYGYAVYSRKCVKETQLMQTPVSVYTDTPINQVLAVAFSRDANELFDDIALLEPDGTFIGLIFARTLVKIQNQLLFRKIRQMQDDLLMAREVQHALLPQSFPESLRPGDPPSLSFAHRYLPADTVSGDFFHTQQIDETTVGVFVCDVMGHGVRSAFVTALLRALVEQMRQWGRQPAQLLEEVNRELLEILPNEDVLMLATALYVVIDLNSQEIVFANAGHPSPIILNGKSLGSGRSNADDFIGSALGLLPDSTYQENTYNFEPGNTLLLYTDGVYEVVDEHGEEFTKDAFSHHAAEIYDGNPDALLASILERARDHAHDHEFGDDVCLVAVKYNS